MAYLREINKELLQKIRLIEIKTRRLSQETFAGQYKTAFRGRGMAFSEVREYQSGDDVRDIDWNVTARYNAPFVKIYEEERELTVMLMIDVSGSLDFGTNRETKRDLVAEIAATLAFSAIENKDKVGVIFFSDHVEKYIPPGKGKKHILFIIREILTFQPISRHTAPQVALNFLMKIAKKKLTAFMISDFTMSISSEKDNYEAALKRTAAKHDLSALVVQDIREQKLTPMGLVFFKDLETGSSKWVNTWSKKVRDSYEKEYVKIAEDSRHLFKRCKIDFAEFNTGEDFTQPLIKLFSRR